MGMDIDKPRRDRQAACINDLIGIFGNLSDGDNPSVRNADITRIAGGAGAVDDRSAGDFDIECHSRILPFCSLSAVVLRRSGCQPRPEIVGLLFQYAAADPVRPVAV